jgi:hypothetical protein
MHCWQRRNEWWLVAVEIRSGAATVWEVEADAWREIMSKGR